MPTTIESAKLTWLRLSSRRLKCSPAEVVIEEGLKTSHRGRFVEVGPIDAEGTYASHNHTYAHGAAAAHVCLALEAQRGKAAPPELPRTREARDAGADHDDFGQFHGT